MIPASTADLRVDDLPVLRDARGALAVAELDRLVPFAVVRLFYVTDAPAATTRGQHGHYRCSQYLLCQSGRIQIVLNDGEQERSLLLAAGQGLLIPPAIFASETYLDSGTVLLVLCDRPYEKEDYIHSLESLRAFRAQSA